MGTSAPLCLEFRLGAGAQALEKSRSERGADWRAGVVKNPGCYTRGNGYPEWSRDRMVP